MTLLGRNVTLLKFYWQNRAADLVLLYVSLIKNGMHSTGTLSYLNTETARSWNSKKVIPVLKWLRLYDYSMFQQV